MDSSEIQKRIPHRAPFLWLDDVLELSETRIVARRFLSPDLPVFAGHYPEFPVFPGVLQCEACFQAAAVLISGLVTPGAGQVPVVTRQDRTQYRKLIRPGDTLCIEVEITERLADVYFLKGRILVDGKVSTRLEFACALAEAES